MGGEKEGSSDASTLSPTMLAPTSQFLAALSTKEHLVLALRRGILGLPLGADLEESSWWDGASFYIPFMRPVKEVRQILCSWDGEDLLVHAAGGGEVVVARHFARNSEFQRLCIFRGFSVKQATFLRKSRDIALLITASKVEAVALYCEKAGRWHFSQVICAKEGLHLHRFRENEDLIDTPEGPKAFYDSQRQLSL
jgi:hypothetical protein